MGAYTQLQGAQGIFDKWHDELDESQGRTTFRPGDRRDPDTRTVDIGGALDNWQKYNKPLEEPLKAPEQRQTAEQTLIRAGGDPQERVWPQREEQPPPAIAPGMGKKISGAMDKWKAATAKPGPYQTELPKHDEELFQAWAKKNDLNMRGQGTPTSDYDPRGFYKGLQEGTVDPNKDMGISPFDHRMHMSDKYKTPYHESFSNESVYATEHAPRWEDGLLVTPEGEVKANEREPMPYQPALPKPELLQMPEAEQPGMGPVALGPTGRNAISYTKPPPPRNA